MFPSLMSEKNDEAMFSKLSLEFLKIDNVWRIHSQRNSPKRKENIE